MEETGSKIENLENEKNKKSLLIADIPITTNENLPKIIRTLGSKPGCTITDQDIEGMFRIKSANAPTPPLIMLKFHRLCMRDKLYNARKMIRQNSIDTKQGVRMRTSCTKSLGFHQTVKIPIYNASIKRLTLIR